MPGTHCFYTPQFKIHRNAGSINFESYGIDVQQPLLFRVRMCSRHKSTTKWQVFILMDPAAEGLQQVKEWYCKCKSGFRTISPCAHAFVAVMIMSTGFQGPIPNRRLGELLGDFQDYESDPSED